MVFVVDSYSESTIRLSALEHIHKQGFVHRDSRKPQLNVLPRRRWPLRLSLISTSLISDSQGADSPGPLMTLALWRSASMGRNFVLGEFERHKGIGGFVFWATRSTLQLVTRFKSKGRSRVACSRSSLLPPWWPTVAQALRCWYRSGSHSPNQGEDAVVERDPTHWGIRPPRLRPICGLWWTHHRPRSLPSCFRKLCNLETGITRNPSPGKMIMCPSPDTTYIISPTGLMSVITKEWSSRSRSNLSPDISSRIYFESG